MRQVSCLSWTCGFFESRPTWSTVLSASYRCVCDDKYSYDALRLSYLTPFPPPLQTTSDPNSDDGQYSPYLFGSDCADFGAHYIEHHRSPTLVVQRPTFEPPALTELTERWRTGEMDDGSHLLHLNE